MTALDTAIIKAYLRQGGLPTSDALKSKETVPPDVAPQEITHTVPLETERPHEDRPPVETARPTSVPFDALELVETALPREIADALEKAETRLLAPGTNTLTGDAATSGTVEPPSLAPSSVSMEPPFVPLLRMDTVSWPRPSRRLRQVAGRQIESLADTVQKTAETAGNLIGVASFSLGEGCTTVLLAVALRLVELGKKTLLIDGDVAQPRLADQLALDNDAGWRDVALGSMPLEDVVTQSESESLALLPYRGQTTPRDGPDPSELSITKLLQRLRSHYDLILVDLGSSLTNNANTVLAERLAGQVDSVLTVHNVRATSSSDLATLRHHLQRLGVRENGTIENFVDHQVG